MLLLPTVCALTLSLVPASPPEPSSWVQGNGGIGGGGGGGGGGNGGTVDRAGGGCPRADGFGGVGGDGGGGGTGGGGKTGTGSGAGGVVPCPVTPGPDSPGSGPASPCPAPSANPGTPAPAAGPGAYGVPASPQTPPSPFLPPTGADLGAWTHWWNHNQAPYLQLRARVQQAVTLTGSDDFYLGRGDGSTESGDLVPRKERVHGEAKQALKRALSQENPTAVRTAAVLALARIGAADELEQSEAIARSCELLAAPNRDLVEASILALGISGAEEALAVLLALVADEPLGRKLCNDREVASRLRAFAAYALTLSPAALGPAVRARVVARLMDVYEADSGKSDEVESALLAAIGVLPLDARGSFDALQGAFKDGRPDRRVLSLRTQLAWLMECFEARGRRAPDANVRAELPIAIARLARLGTPALREAVAQALLPALHDANKESNEVRASLALALGELGDCDAGATDEKIRRALTDLCDSADPMSRRFALVALGRLAGRSGDGINPEGGREAVRKVLLEVLSKGRSQLEPWAALALGMEAHARRARGEALDPAAATALRYAVAQCRRPQEIGAFALALGLAKDANAAELLAERLQSMEDSEARAPLALALGLIGDTSMIPMLRELLAEAHAQPALFVDLSVALGLVGDKDVVPELLKILLEAKSQGTRLSASLALGRVGDARALAPLIAQLDSKEETSFTRAAAARALGAVCDPRVLPWETELSVGSNYSAEAPCLTDGQAGVLDYEQ